MTKKLNKSKQAVSVWKNALKSFAKCLIVLVFGVYFVVSSIFAITPSSLISVFNTLGLKNAEEACYIRAYEKTENNVDLYNLIVFEGKLEKHNLQLYYINKLINDKDYDKFAEKLDNSMIISLAGKNKDLIAYTCNTKAYLLNQKVECLFELDETVSTFVHANLKGDYIKESSFATYVKFIQTSSLSAEEKVQEYHALIETFTGSGGVVIKVSDLVDERIQDLKTKLETETNYYEKVHYRFTLMNLWSAKYTISKSGIGPWEEVECRDNYEAAISDYNKLF